MKMKLFVVLAALSASYVLGTSLNSENGSFERIVYPTIMEYFDSDGKSVVNNFNEHHRSIRTTGACQVPENRTDSYINCKDYPNRIHCTQLCVYGHTLSSGIFREMKCRKVENKWEPVPEFEVCQPFVDCTVSVTDGGKFRCILNYLRYESKCQVSCEHFEDEIAVPKAWHHCDINGRWTPKLPFCAKGGSGIDLVPPPEGPKHINDFGPK